jgi:hypothetical protein
MNNKFTDEEFDKIYEKFVTNEAKIGNCRFRPENVSLWDVLAESQDEFFASPEGAVIDGLVKTNLQAIIGA